MKRGPGVTNARDGMLLRGMTGAGSKPRIMPERADIEGMVRVPADIEGTVGAPWGDALNRAMPKPFARRPDPLTSVSWCHWAKPELGLAGVPKKWS